MVAQVSPYGQLIKMLETRIQRQEAALADSRMQLDGARKSEAEWQKDLQRDWAKEASPKK